jgi:PKD repeat protein
LEVTGFNLVQEYSWLELGPGQCPKEGQFTDSDLEMNLIVDPEGIIANYMVDDWLTLRPGSSLDADHDGILDVLLPVDHEPGWLGTGDVITYTLSYANLGSETAKDVMLHLEALGGLSISGGRTIFLDDISPETTGTVQFTARIIDNEDRSAELQVKVVDAAHGESNWLWALHLIDRDPPTDIVMHSPKNYVHSGSVAVSGEAQDASGLMEVVIQIGGNTVCSDMDPENGAWTCLWEVPDGIDGQVFELEIYGTDLYGSTSAPVSTSMTLDNTAPIVELDQASLDALVDNILVPGEFTLSGIVEDNYQAVGVKLCISRDSGKKCVEVISQPNDGQVSGWVYDLNPYPSDGAMETLEVFGLDAAGNQASEALTFEYEVDNLGPQIDVLTQRTFIWMGEEPVPVLAGTVEDSHGVEEMFVSVRNPNAEIGWFGIDIIDGQWEFSLTFEDPGPYHLRLYGRDGVGNVKGYGPYPVYYMIPSQTLQVEAGSDQVAVEGEEVNVVAAFQDSNTQSTHTAIIDWGEGLPEAGSIDEGYGTGTVSGSHIYTNRGQYIVQICVSDQDGASACDSFTVQVKGQAPLVEAGEDQEVDEGETVSLDPATFPYIPSQAPYTATIDWGDGTSEDGEVGQTNGLGSVSGSHIYLDQGLYTVTVSVTDVDGDAGSDTLVVTVNDLAPTAGFSWLPDPPDEGLPIQFTDETSSYPDEIVAWAWDFGSQGTSSDQNPSFTFSDEGEFDVCLTVTDDDNSSDTICHIVMVTNAAPIVEADEDKVISEGEGIALVNTSFRDTGSLDTHTATIDWGDGSPVEDGYVHEPQPGEDGSVEGSHDYGDNGTFTVTISVCDEAACGEDTFEVTVNNLVPVLELDTTGLVSFAGGDAFLGRKGVLQTHEAWAIDPGSDDLIFEWSFGVTHTYFNDGVGPDPFPSTAGVFPFQAMDTADVMFDVPGIQNVAVEVQDDDGGMASESFLKVVTGEEDWNRSRIYWLRQFSGRGRPQIDEATLQAYLDVVNFASRIFSEEVPASTIEEARQVLKISRHDLPGLVKAYLLTAWLNFASGAIDWDQPIFTHWRCRDERGFHVIMYQLESLWLMRSAMRFDFALLRGFILLKNLERGKMPGFCR